MTIVETAPVVIEVAEPNEAQRVLLEARDLIADDRRWTRTVWTDFNGAYCSLGALGAATGLDDIDLFSIAIFRSLREAGVEAPLLAAVSEMRGRVVGHLTGVYDFNDRQNHATVMRMFNRAIELAA